MSNVDSVQLIRGQVLSHFPGWEVATVEPLGRGLINQTFLLTAQNRRSVLQRMAPIFSPAINENIAAVTSAEVQAAARELIRCYVLALTMPSG